MGPGVSCFFFRWDERDFNKKTLVRMVTNMHVMGDLYYYTILICVKICMYIYIYAGLGAWSFRILH